MIGKRLIGIYFGLMAVACAVLSLFSCIGGRVEAFKVGDASFVTLQAAVDYCRNTLRGKDGDDGPIVLLNSDATDSGAVVDGFEQALTIDLCSHTLIISNSDTGIEVAEGSSLLLCGGNVEAGSGNSSEGMFVNHGSMVVDNVCADAGESAIPVLVAHGGTAEIKGGSSLTSLKSDVVSASGGASVTSSSDDVKMEGSISLADDALLSIDKGSVKLTGFLAGNGASVKIGNGAVVKPADGNSVDDNNAVDGIEAFAAHEHEFSEEWSIDETHHWHVAVCGHSQVVADRNEHSFPDDWSLSADGTVETRNCFVCGYEQTREAQKPDEAEAEPLFQVDDDGVLVICDKDRIVGDVVIPSSIEGKTVTKIGEGAFANCIGLTGIEIPSSVTSMDDSVFYGCKNLTNVMLSNSLTNINTSTFEGCSSLTSIEIPSSVTFIDSCAFKFTGLTSIEIPSSVTSIEGGVFHGCVNLTSVTIPSDSKLNYIYGDGAHGAPFRGCTSLKSIDFGGTSNQWNSIYKDLGWNTIGDGYPYVSVVFHGDN